MYYRSLFLWHSCIRLRIRRVSATLLLFCVVLLVLTSCGGGSGTITLSNGKSALASDQTLTIPLIGSTDIPALDPTAAVDASEKIFMGMLYSGLVRTDADLHVLPDQATWNVSTDQKIYTFKLNPQVSFADGTSLTAQSYVASWTRAALPTNTSPLVPTYMYVIAGARDLHEGHAKTLAGVRALDDQTLQVTLTKPTPSFLATLALPLFFPVNQKVIATYGQQPWPVSVAEQGVGTGPFIVKDVTHNVKMTLIPNPHYYGNKLLLRQVNVYFVNDRRVAFTASRASHYDLVWDLAPTDQLPAAKLSGFTSSALLQTDALFFDTTQAPFNIPAVRQAFAIALNKKTLSNGALTKSIFSSVSAETLLAPGMPAYQDQPTALDAQKAKALLQSAYPDRKQMPAVTFTYPISLVSPDMALALQNMWRTAFDVKVNLRPLNAQAYAQEMAHHTIAFGLFSLKADVADPSVFAEQFLSSAQGVTQWQDTEYDRLVTQAEMSTGDARLALYHQAEQRLLTEHVIVPLDHQNMTALIPVWIQGVSVNGAGLSFGDWSKVAILSHSK